MAISHSNIELKLYLGAVAIKAATNSVSSTETSDSSYLFLIALSALLRLSGLYFLFILTFVHSTFSSNIAVNLLNSSNIFPVGPFD